MEYGKQKKRLGAVFVKQMYLTVDIIRFLKLLK